MNFLFSFKTKRKTRKQLPLIGRKRSIYSLHKLCRLNVAVGAVEEWKFHTAMLSFCPTSPPTRADETDHFHSLNDNFFSNLPPRSDQERRNLLCIIIIIAFLYPMNQQKLLHIFCAASAQNQSSVSRMMKERCASSYYYYQRAESMARSPTLPVVVVAVNDDDS